VAAIRPGLQGEKIPSSGAEQIRISCVLTVDNRGFVRIFPAFAPIEGSMMATGHRQLAWSGACSRLHRVAAVRVAYAGLYASLLGNLLPGTVGCRHVR
jgi:hypothetical protein